MEMKWLAYLDLDFMKWIAISKSRTKLYYFNCANILKGYSFHTM